MIENFSLLSPEEQKQFATDLIAKLNAAGTLSDETFKIFAVESDELDGTLMIGITADATIKRGASWQCENRDEVRDVTDTYNFLEPSAADAKQLFKTTATEFEGYLLEVAALEIDDYKIEDVSEVYSISEEDAGIGSYEYWGEVGYDSQPYCEVRGALDIRCSISGWLVVTPK